VQAAAHTASNTTACVLAARTKALVNWLAFIRP
jgi:hypothetical protein